jgi:hypothetical protein
MPINGKSKARIMQETSASESKERRIRLTVIDNKATEYHLNPYESVVKGILDPDTPDAFIEVPIEPMLRSSVVHAFLHTSQIAKLYVHDELTQEVGG